MLKRSDVRAKARAFAAANRKTPEELYLALLALYMLTFMIREVSWQVPDNEGITRLRLLCLSLSVWGAALHLFLTGAEGMRLWNKPLPLVGLGAALAAAAYLFGTRMSTNSYSLVMDLFFIVMACGRNHRRIVRCMLLVTAFTLTFAALGLPLGYTREAPKPQNASPGRGFGIGYPNNWGYLSLFVLLALWYLYFQRKAALTFLLFWGLALFQFFVVSCRTSAALAFLFPLLCGALYGVFPRGAGKSLPGGPRLKAVETAAACLPALCFALTAALCFQMEWVHRTFYQGPLRTMAMRFVQGGILFREYGLPLFGHQAAVDLNKAVVLNGQTEQFYVMDSAYVACAMTRGMLWTAGCLAWLGFSQARMVRRGNAALLAFSVTMLLLSFMERPGLAAWFNFALLYPPAGEDAGKTEKNMVKWKEKSGRKAREGGTVC